MEQLNKTSNFLTFTRQTSATNKPGVLQFALDYWLTIQNEGESTKEPFPLQRVHQKHGIQ